MPLLVEQLIRLFPLNNVAIIHLQRETIHLIPYDISEYINYLIAQLYMYACCVFYSLILMFFLDLIFRHTLSVTTDLLAIMCCIVAFIVSVGLAEYTVKKANIGISNRRIHTYTARSWNGSSRAFLLFRRIVGIY